MELDLLAAAETESDSESNHSNQDNASGRRSVVTAATAGSEAGMPHHLVFHLAVEVLKLSYTGQRNASGFNSALTRAGLFSSKKYYPSRLDLDSYLAFQRCPGEIIYFAVRLSRARIT